MSRESDISSLESRLGRRGSLTQRFAMQNEDKEKGWNRDVHPTRIHYYPDKGPMSPKKIQISREKRKETLRMLPTSTAGVARIATDASRERLLHDRVMAWEEQQWIEHHTADWNQSGPGWYTARQDRGQTWATFDTRDRDRSNPRGSEEWSRDTRQRTWEGTAQTYAADWNTAASIWWCSRLNTMGSHLVATTGDTQQGCREGQSVWMG